MALRGRLMAVVFCCAMTATACSSAEPATELAAAGASSTTTTTVAATTTTVTTTPSTTSTAAGTTESDADPDGDRCWRVEDFGDEASARWAVVNDGVMGGLSEGSLLVDGGVATFAGTINTNGGGFSMIRTSVLRDGVSLVDGLAGAEYLRMRTRSADGRTYELTVQDTTQNSSVMHFGEIEATEAATWREVLVPLSGLEARTFGTTQGALAPFELDAIGRLGIILADGVDGQFSLDIDYVDACADMA